ncbi:MAG: hypothetical protein COV55_03045 [Candidatus Komeilibacteria bacterium CG11_big_fil_rev_8_21_14_0_20_36_20]|uniref:Type II secretion system protein GspG C-terminal domain-containing protein n=1 Tax=Candidatus Komeilibacteria bacterium CG11_big_fil_rev_8_21_14_0_20_36_20 TaxID=1974477 RepID=A0A2H0NC70_9BACT|nr:MAG: hypothetical protein COV55_03045 [Candidatus Komeilibacteria bacterium CG11_big_fil_rev_8_21_14_0_20_36_20]PIR81755.1 MAG: hypothetical protein COU21_01785 [Candidatus Komeilibacteria bacterium CG10_big_fil_rev_8_21_14_0_10_36_65]PJC55572.1 MAG: hypothetical protein CO027_01410 [Candidatus Komeilibacteria bacterium CG_4_9_14_0_2_um_filter_36_13]
MLVNNSRGITLVGLIITVGILAILFGVAYATINPVTRLKNAEDEARRHDILFLSDALFQYARDHRGVLPVLGEITTNKKVICSAQGALRSCAGDNEYCILIDDQDFFDDYLSELPIDPDLTSDTNTGYYLQKDSDTGYLIVGACSTNGNAITHKSAIKVSCAAYGGGYCWYFASSVNQTCNTVCANNDLVCVPNVTPGPDTGPRSFYFCSLNKVFDSCSGGCTDEAGSNRPPTVNPTTGACEIYYPDLSCTYSSASYKNICPCQ